MNPTITERVEGFFIFLIVLLVIAISGKAPTSEDD
jgi:hypothetical protein